jgi:hypothetical protein
MQGLRERLLGVLFPIETDNWLTILRIGLGLQTALYSRDWDGSSISGHILACVKRRSSQLHGVVWVLRCGLLIGLTCRFSAILAWFLHLCAAKSGGLVSYGVDNFMTIGLFYLMLSPLPDRYSLDRRVRELRSKNPQMLGF